MSVFWIAGIALFALAIGIVAFPWIVNTMFQIAVASTANNETPCNTSITRVDVGLHHFEWKSKIFGLDKETGMTTIYSNSLFFIWTKLVNYCVI